MSILNRQSATPLYLQLKKLLQEQIGDGALLPHSRVPSERELSEQYAISRMTARQALAELIQEGRLYTSAGKGTFVADPKISQNLHSLSSFSEEIRARGLVPTTRLLASELRPVPAEIAARLSIEPGVQVAVVERLRLANNEPLALETAWLTFAGMERLVAMEWDGSLYGVLKERFGIIPSEAVQEFEARQAYPHEARFLQLPDGAAVLSILRVSLDTTNRPFEYVQSLYRSDRYRFVARLVRQGEGA